MGIHVDQLKEELNTLNQEERILEGMFGDLFMVFIKTKIKYFV